MVTIKSGNLLDATEKVIAHQVNCWGVVAGLAADIFYKWPYAENDYQQLVDRIPLNSALLGLAQFTGEQKDGHIICNLYGQFEPGRDYCPLELEKALFMLASQSKIHGWSVALPYGLSCGICGGNWDEVLSIIERTMDGVDCAIYKREGE